MNKDEENMVDELDVDDDYVYINYDITSYPSDFTLKVIADMWKDGEIIIPDYQRDFVWNIKQSSLLIDSFLRGLPVPALFFYLNEANNNIVIDGQQRILSIVYFFNGFFGDESSSGKRRVFRLTGLGDSNPYNNKTFLELNEKDQKKLQKSVLRAMNIKQLSPNDGTSAYHIFERLNTGGTPLSSQEIRNCVFQGELNTKLKEINKNSYWRAIFGTEKPHKNQKDVELLLRVFALSNNINKYEKPMKEFLNKSMSIHRDGNSPEVQYFFEILPSVLKNVVNYLGEKPFHLRGPLNVSALDSVLCVLLVNYNEIKFVRIKECFDKLVKDSEFNDVTVMATADVKIINKRINIVQKYLIEHMK